MYCGGTGLYKGFAEPEGHAVICNRCHGKGHMDFGKVAFTGRKTKQGIQWVLLDGGLWMMRGPESYTNKISVSEFREKVSE